MTEPALKNALIMSDVGSLQQLVEKRGMSEQVTFIVYDGLDYPPGYGRAFGEMRLSNTPWMHPKLHPYDFPSWHWVYRGLKRRWR